MPPTTTIQQDVTTASQRKVNLIWEYTQAVVALIVVFANMIVGVYFGIQAAKGVDNAEFPYVLSNALFLVLGFYYARTNHQNVGGTGAKKQDEQAYLGR